MLLEQIQSDLRAAQLSHDEITVSTLRLLISELKYAEINSPDNFGDTEIISVVQKELKKRKEAAIGFRQGNSEERAQKEENEAKILEKYLPIQISTDELEIIIDEVIGNLKASSMAQMGQVMQEVKSKVGQAAEPSRISARVKEKLSS